MADLTITVPDPAVARVQAAFGKSLGTVDGSNVPRDATTEEVRQAIVQFLEDTVTRIDKRDAAATASDAVTDVGAS